MKAFCNYDCWLVHHTNREAVEVSIAQNAHEVLFIANRKANSTMTKIDWLFQNVWPGDRHRKKPRLDNPVE